MRFSSWDFMLLGSYAVSLWFFLRLDGKLSDQISCFFAVVNEVSFWDFTLFVTKFVLIYVSFRERLAGRDVNSCSSGSRVGSGVRLVARRWCKGIYAGDWIRERGGGEGRQAFWPWWDFLMRCHAFLAVMSFLRAISCEFWPLWVSWDFRMSVHAFWPQWDFLRFFSLTRFPYKISCFAAA